MFFIIYNFIAVGVIFAAIVVGGLVSAVFTSAPHLGYVVGGVVGAILDLAYRFKYGEGDIFHPRKGGHVFYIPVWILGGFWILGSLGEMAANSMQNAQGSSSRASNREPIAYARSSQPDRQPAGGSTWANDVTKPKVVLADDMRNFDGLKVAMIAGTPGHLVATINGEPFSDGESHKLRVGQERVVVQCVQVRDQSVLLKIQGQPNPILLQVGQSAPLARQ